MPDNKKIVPSAPVFGGICTPDGDYEIAPEDTGSGGIKTVDTYIAPAFKDLHVLIEELIVAELQRPKYDSVWNEYGFAGIVDLHDRLRTELRSEFSARMGWLGVAEFLDAPAGSYQDMASSLEAAAQYVFDKVPPQAPPRGADRLKPRFEDRSKAFEKGESARKVSEDALQTKRGKPEAREKLFK
ncbi:MAG TPA: hypothetical protein VFX30_14405 [bacterium]|nr:hypothetical protein [bacterium]